MRAKQRGSYCQRFVHAGKEHVANVREYVTFWEGEIDASNRFKVYKDERRRVVTSGILAWVFVHRHFMKVYTKK